MLLAVDAYGNYNSIGDSYSYIQHICMRRTSRITHSAVPLTCPPQRPSAIAHHINMHHISHILIINTHHITAVPSPAPSMTLSVRSATSPKFKGRRAAQAGEKDRDDEELDGDMVEDAALMPSVPLATAASPLALVASPLAPPLVLSLWVVLPVACAPTAVAVPDSAANITPVNKDVSRHMLVSCSAAVRAEERGVAGRRG